MAHLGTTFDPAAVQSDSGGFEPLPAGTYDLHIVDSEIKQTKSGGDMLVLVCEVTSGPMTGRRVWLRLNIRNDNAQAQEIAHRDLKKICDVTGTGPIQDSDDLHFKPFKADVIVTPDRGYGPGNDLRNYKPPGTTTATTISTPASRPQASRPTAVPSPAATTASPRPARPWGNSGGAQPRAVENEDQIPF
ncbi:hypothetical protein SB2_06950 [Methylobacterium radiotolerans]|nr:hypothetical protein SB3_08995 [Methylobacterium radiotolerans]KTS49280.1 hypothetical protein SB2_06950 [Methylobacterium radiotolerans]